MRGESSTAGRWRSREIVEEHRRSGRDRTCGYPARFHGRVESTPSSLTPRRMKGKTVVWEGDEGQRKESEVSGWHEVSGEARGTRGEGAGACSMAQGV